MKRFVVTIALIVVSLVAGAYVRQKNRVQAMSVRVNVKDLPAHGVRIIPSSDPSFDQRVATFLKGQPERVIEAIKPFSAILENTSEFTIVGSRVNWEIVKLDGTTVSMPVGSANPRALMSRGESRASNTTGGAAVPPHSTRFVSLLGSAGEREQVGLANSWLGFRGSKTEMDEFNNAVLQGNREEAFNRSVIGKLLREATSVTVSIDGVFFEDGTFVGEDKTGFFDEVKAYIDAEYDLVTEISNAQKETKTTADVFKRVTDFLTAHTRTGSDSPLADHYARNAIPDSQRLTALASVKFSSDRYQNYKTLYAQQLVRTKDALGASEAITQALKLLEKPRLELRKK